MGESWENNDAFVYPPFQYNCAPVCQVWEARESVRICWYGERVAGNCYIFFYVDNLKWKLKVDDMQATFQRKKVSEAWRDIS